VAAAAALLAAAALAAAAPPAGIPPADLRSGTTFLSPETRAIQADDFANAGMLWVEDGAAHFRRPEGPARRACSTCHGEPSSLKGVAARYPAVDAASGALLDLEGRINACRTRHQQVPALDRESPALLALTAVVAHQSRGMPISVGVDGAARPFFEEGQRLYTTRVGQLDLACTHCHDRNWGRSLGGEPLSQGHPTGYPIYRLEWQTAGSLQRRLRSCFAGVRAEPYAYGAPELASLTLFLAWRARGLPVETPAVRR
jgi:sulfur-oxidizing protein SoxA